MILVVVLAAALVATLTTEMVVDVSLSGSVTAGGASDGPDIVLIARDELIAAVRIGQPVRLRIGELNGWGVVGAVTPNRAQGTKEHVAVTVHVLDPRLRAATIKGQGCDGRVLVGFVKTIRGLWSLATNQAPRATRGTPDELRIRIPLELRNTESYRRLERHLIKAEVG
jgi:hypothetical protein